MTGHNTHVARWESSDSMGKLLADEMGKGYYVIGTDFYKTRCNVPDQSTGKRTNQVFYSHDPLANAAKKAGFDICWLDFSKIPADTPWENCPGIMCIKEIWGELCLVYAPAASKLPVVPAAGNAL